MSRQDRRAVPTRNVARTRSETFLSSATSTSRRTGRSGGPASGETSSTSPPVLASASASTMYPAVRQLRSRLVPIPASDAAGITGRAVAAPVRGRRRRSRSAASSRASESTSCNGVSAVPAAGRSLPVPQTKTRTRTRSARMTLSSSSSSLRRLAAPQRPVLRTSRADRNVQSGASRTVAVKAQRKTALAKQEKQSAEQVTVSCGGCQEKMLPCNVESHQSQCCLRFPCPLACHDNCQWGGTISQAVDHILKNHRAVNCSTGPSTIITMKSWRKAAPIQWVTLQTCLGKTFLTIIQKIDKNRCPFFLGIVRLFGHQEDANRFEYRMQLKTRGKIGARTFSYSTTVKGLHDGNTAMNEGDCFVFDTSHAEIFSFEGNLEIGVSISVMKM